MAALRKLAEDYLGGALSAAEFRVRAIAVITTLSESDLADLALVIAEQGRMQ